MIGIYNDEFLEYLRNLNLKPRTTSRNIIIVCPWCEYGQEKDHYHLYISTEAPIFHCFHANCPSDPGGHLGKLIRKIAGHDISQNFVDKKKLEEAKKYQKTFVDKEEKSFDVKLPSLNPTVFKLKEMYLRKRLKFANVNSRNIRGLIYDVHSFLNMNNIPVDPTLFRIREYLHSNFIGFLTERKSTVVFRNIDDHHTMRYYKLKIHDSNFLDYYRLSGNNFSSNKVVLAEGIFDIYSEHIYDFLNIKSDVRLYASVNSSKYAGLLHSIVFNEQMFRLDVVILSDRGIPVDYYKKFRYYNRHIINSLSVYYNKTGKDFNDIPVTPELILT